jgi:WD40 repeat protein
MRMGKPSPSTASRAGGRLCVVPPVFSADSDVLFAASAAGRVRAIAAASSRPIRTLEAHSLPSADAPEPITALWIAPSNPLQLCAIDAAGTVHVWDTTDGALLRSLRLGLAGAAQVLAASASPGLATFFVVQHVRVALESVRLCVSMNVSLCVCWCVLVSRRPCLCGSGCICMHDSSLLNSLGLPRAYSLLFSSQESDGTKKIWRTVVSRVTTDALMTPESVQQVVVFDCSGAAQLALSPSGTTLAAVSGKRLFVCDHETKQTKQYVTHLSGSRAMHAHWLASSWTHVRFFRVVAFHGTLPQVITGDERGHVVVWHVLGDRIPSQPVRTSLHWHAHPVRCLAASQDGTTLLSGGREGVLVFWQLVNGQRTFLPRLGAPIEHICISPNGQRIAVALNDNVVRFINYIDMTLGPSLVGLLAGPLPIKSSLASSVSPVSHRRPVRR